MMKSIKVFTALVLALGFLGSCGQNLNEPELQPQGDVEQGTQIAYVELEGGTSSDDLRISEIVKISTGESLEMVMADLLDLNVRVAVRRGSGKPVYQTLRFTKIKGQKKVTYKGNIQIPTGGSGDYQLVAVVLGEEKGRSFAHVDKQHQNLVLCEEGRLEQIHRQNNDRGQVIYSIPYMTDWQRITVSADGKRIAPLSLRFKPNCTLLRIQLKNSTEQPQTIKALKISGNLFTTRWTYDLARNLNSGLLKYGDSRPNSFHDKEFNLPAPITLKPNQKSDWYYIWGMPSKQTVGLRMTILAKTTGNEFIFAFGSSAPLNIGNVPLELNLRGARVSGDFDSFGNEGAVPDQGPVGKAIGSDFPGGRLPLEYVAEYNLAPGGKRLATSHHNDASGYFYFSEMKQIFDSSDRHLFVTPQASYYLPFIEEMEAAVMPTNLPTNIDNGRYIKNHISAAVFQGNKTMIDIADFYQENQRRLYAVRYKGGDYRNLVAYKYELEGNFVEGNRDSRLKVTSRYIGNEYKGRSIVDLDGAIYKINQASFWAKNKERDVVVYLSYPGEVHQGTTTIRRGQRGYYLFVSSFFDRSGSGANKVWLYTIFEGLPADLTGGKGEVGEYSNKFAVRPFRSYKN